MEHASDAAAQRDFDISEVNPARGEARMHLAAFTSAGPVSGIHGGWRHPAADRDLLAAGYYARIARTLIAQGVA